MVGTACVPSRGPPDFCGADCGLGGGQKRKRRSGKLLLTSGKNSSIILRRQQSRTIPFSPWAASSAGVYSRAGRFAWLFVRERNGRSRFLLYRRLRNYYFGGASPLARNCRLTRRSATERFGLLIPTAPSWGLCPQPRRWNGHSKGIWIW